MPEAPHTDDFPRTLATFFHAYAERLDRGRGPLPADRRAAGRCLDEIIARSPIAILLVDEAGMVLRGNATAASLLDHGRRSLQGASFASMHGSPGAFRNAMRRLKEGGPPTTYEGPVRGKDGKVRHLAVAVSALRGDRNRTFACLLLDLTTRKATEDRLRHLALHDPLTGLHNRTYFMSVLQTAFARCKRDARAGFGILMLDLDRFKTINDSFGHQKGDQVLRKFARRLQRACRESDTLARLHGDEFAVLLEGVAVSEAEPLAERIRNGASGRSRIGDEDIDVTCSGGVVVCSPAHGTLEALIREADLALYRAKARGRARCEAPSTQPEVEAFGAALTAEDLRRAVREQDFVLHFQPIVSLADGRTSGVEALVRLRRSDEQLVRPAEFVRLAEGLGLMADVGRWVVRAASEQLRDWMARGSSPFMSVNVSPRLLTARGFGEEVAWVVAELGLPAGSFWIEVPEEVLFDEEAIAVCASLASLGVRIAVDDFGTGSVSFARLKDLPIHAVKVDGSLVRHRPDPRETTLLRGIINLAHDLGIMVVAEGVEDEGQLQEMRRLGCDLAQGFRLSPPIDAEALARRLLAAVPGARGAHRAPRHPRERVASRRSAQAAPRPAGVRPLEVLVVDDDADARELLAALVSAKGFGVRTARDGREALECLRRSAPSLILVDMVMPTMDGWALRSVIGADPALARIPLVVLSGVTPQAVRGDALPATTWLTKPVDFCRLEAVLDGLSGSPPPALA